MDVLKKYCRSVGHDIATHKVAYSALAIFALLMAIIIPRHEPWVDEAQAWLLAKDAGFHALFGKYIHYEGSPGLWHLLLMVLAKLNMPYWSMSWLSGFIATATAFLVARFSPFPIWLRVTLPFTYFFFYQYAIVARSYVLLTFLLVLVAALYASRFNKPWLYFIALGLLANTSAHGLLTAAFISLYWVGEYLHKLINRQENFAWKSLIPLAALAIGGGLALWQLIPAPDLAFAKGYQTNSYVLIHDTIDKITSTFTGREFLSFLLLGISVVWFFARRTLLLFLLLIGPIMILETVKYANLWHQGIILLCWVFAAWVACEQPADRLRRFEFPLRQAFYTLTAVLVGTQIYWSIFAYRHDYQFDYSASRTVADYIKRNGYQSQPIFATGFHSESIEPYFDHNIFYNYNNGDAYRFWFWTTAGSLDENIARVALEKPRLVVWGIKSPAQHKLPSLPADYRLVKIFRGSIIWKTGIAEEDSFAVYRRTD